MEFDERGWAAGRIEPLPLASAWTLLSPEPDARVDGPRWEHQARTFFSVGLMFPRPKSYPSGTLPLADAVEVDVGLLGAAEPTRVAALTVPLDRAPEARRAALAGAAAIGGAGMDAVVLRAKRLWQVDARVAHGGDDRAPLV